jgi:glycosyltransferase involved in cell wall biosynthesis
MADSRIFYTVFTISGICFEENTRMNPRVCIDIRPTQTGAKHTGTGVYARELTKALLGLDCRMDIWYLVLANYSLPDLNLPPSRLIRIWRPRKPERWHIGYDMLRLSKQLAARGFDLVHSLVPGVIHKTSKMRVVVTMLDLIPLIYPNDCQMSVDVRWLYQRRLRSVVDTDCLISISKTTKQDLVSHLRIEKERIVPIYLAPSPNFHPVSKEVVAAFKKRLGLPKRYILYLGGYSYRKNVPLLLHAFHQLGQLRRDIKLVLTGTGYKGVDHVVRDLIAELCLEDEVIWSGFVRNEDLPALYCGASLFVYPSLYEGFGLPVLEAMSCGVPVITSKAGSLSEVAGNAAILVEPDDLAGLVAAMQEVLEDTVLQDDLRRLGQAHASTFSWERCARETLLVYERVLS